MHRDERGGWGRAGPAGSWEADPSGVRRPPFRVHMPGGRWGPWPHQHCEVLEVQIVAVVPRRCNFGFFGRWAEQMARIDKVV